LAVGGAADHNRGWWAVGGDGGDSGGDLADWCSVANSAWAVGNGQGGWLGHCVGGRALSEDGWAWADSDIGRNSSSGDSGVLGRRNNSGAGTGGLERGGDLGGVGAWAVGDCQGSCLGDSVGLGALGESGGGWAVGGQDVSGQGDNGCSSWHGGVGIHGLSRGDEPEGRDDGGEGLHFDEDQTTDAVAKVIEVGYRYKTRIYSRTRRLQQRMWIDMIRFVQPQFRYVLMTRDTYSNK